MPVTYIYFNKLCRKVKQVVLALTIIINIELKEMLSFVRKRMFGQIWTNELDYWTIGYHTMNYVRIVLYLNE